jgi:hypothetical protein
VSKSFPKSVLSQYHLMNVSAPRFLHVSQSLRPQSHEVSTTAMWYFRFILDAGSNSRLNLKGSELGAGAEVVALELQIETATCKSKFTRGARDVAAVAAKSIGNHATLYLGQRDGERNVLQISIGH